MKKVFIAIGILVLVAVLGTVAWGGAVYLGWLPVPRLITAEIAKVRGMSPEEADALYKVTRVYRVLKTAPEAPLFDQAVVLATNRSSSPEAWMKFAQDAYPQISAPTLEKIRTELGVQPEDFAAAQTLLQGALDQFKKVGRVTITPSQQEQLRLWDHKYHLSELFKKIR